MLQAGFLLFPELTQLDLTGPAQVLSRLEDLECHFVARSLGPVETDCGFQLLPTTSFEACPPLDILCVPGGFGVEKAIQDPDTVAFVELSARTSKFVTSVCTGAFLLGVAGLLNGRRATTHWAYRSALPLVGATPSDARVVRDGSVVTGAGVTAGIDFALELAGELRGRRAAETIQLALEYDPHPPWDAGSPERAEASVIEPVRSRFDDRRVVFERSVRAARDAQADRRGELPGRSLPPD